MRRDVHDALASQFAAHGIVRQLHDVPPHEVYEVRVDGRRAVYKGDVGPTGRAATEGRVIAFVGERTSVPVPDVLAVGTEHYVAAWHPDAPDLDGGRTGDETWARAAGRGLATLHEETGPLIDEYGRFRPSSDGSTLPEDDGTAGSRDDTAVHEDDGSAIPRDDGITVAGNRGIGGIGNGEIAIVGNDDWHAAAIAYVRRHRPVLARHGQADVADALVDFLDERPDVFAGADGPVCCHGWATPEHVAVEDERVGCIVDFEHAIAAPGEFDYWRTVLPTFGRDVGPPRRAFREGYESVRSLPAGFERRRPLYAALNGIYYLESLYVQDQHGPAETAERAEWFRDGIVETVDSLS